MESDKLGTREELELFRFKERFSLSGYIIHDPQSKDGFGEHLTRSFKRLSDLTGFNFLFTAFIALPEEEEDKIPKSLDRNGTDKSLASNLPYFYAEFISEHLNINSSSLPYIILTDNPKSNKFYVIELHQKNLMQVMWDLTDVADKLSRVKKFFKLGRKDVFKEDFTNHIGFDILIERLDYRIFKIEGNKSLSTQLLECALVLQKYSNDRLYDVQRFLSEEWVRDVIETLSNKKIEEFKTADLLKVVCRIGPITSREKELLLMDLMGILFEAEFEEFKNCLENDVYANLLDGALLYSKYDEQYFSDSSPFMLPFFKAFEKEMTYSLVHWIREHLAIDLPEYFLRYEPKKEAILRKGNSYFDFNQQRANTTVWQPPMIGGQVKGFEILTTEQFISPFKSVEESKAFLEIGRKIMNIRNQATHTGAEGASSLRAIIYKWRELWKDGYLVQLNILKSKYGNL